MAKQQAIFVDGVGTVREMSIIVETERFFVPLPPDPHFIAAPPTRPERHDATFNRLGKLSDGRTVYGQDVARLTLWRFEHAITDEARRDLETLKYWKDETQNRLDRFLRAESRDPVAVLSDSEIRDDQSGVVNRVIEGVARRS